MISIKHLTHDYGKGNGIFDLSLEIPQGEVFGFLGPNGAGKTTTLRHLIGDVKAQRGTCHIHNFDCWSQQNAIQAITSYLPSELHFFEEMTADDFIKFIEAYRQSSNPSRRNQLVERFKLDTKQKISKMSKGTRQKLGIILTFMLDTQVYLLDEPSSGLDPLMQKELIDLIKEEKTQGKTFFLSSHIFEEIIQTCDRIGMIKEGKLLTIDQVEKVMDKHYHEYLVTLESEPLAAKFAFDFKGIQEGRHVKVPAPTNIEEIFMAYYGGEKHD